MIRGKAQDQIWGNSEEEFSLLQVIRACAYSPHAEVINNGHLICANLTLNLH